MSSHTIVFGSITMVSSGVNTADANGVQYIVTAQDTNRGNPAPVTTALLSLMRIGGPVAWDHTENRQPVLRVRIKAATYDALALGERALQLECEKPNTLSWTPPDGVTASVFDIVWSQMELVEDDVQELHFERTYLVRLTALPRARGKDLVVTAAQSAAETSIDDGSSATGWSVLIGASVTSTAGAIVLTSTTPAGANPAIVQGQRTGSVSLTGNFFLRVRWKSSTPTRGGRLTVTLTGVSGPLSESYRSDAGSGYFDSYFALPAGTGTVSAMQFYAEWKGATSAQTLSIDAVAKATALPFIGTTRQKAMSLVPGGSVKTQGSIQVAHATAALGDVIVYTHPSGTGYLPPLRQWRSASDTVNTDATRVSGAFNALTGNMTFTIPISIVPEGDTQLWARVGSSSGTGDAVIQWGASSLMGSTVVGGLLQGTTTVNFAAVGTWFLVPLARFSSPTAQVGPSGYVQVGLQKISGTPVVQIDEAWLFAMDYGRLTVIQCGSGTTSVGGPSNRLWVDAPSQDEPQGAVFRGNAADRSDAWHAGSVAVSWETHDFEPTGTNVFVVTTDASDASTSLEHYRRYHTHVAST